MADYGARGPVLLYQQTGKIWKRLNAATGRQKETELAGVQKLKPDPQFSSVPKHPDFERIMLPLGNQQGKTETSSGQNGLQECLGLGQIWEQTSEWGSSRKKT